jgi:hypothetical protein
MTADRDQTRRFLGALHGCAPPGSLVELRFRLGPGMGQRFLRAERLGRVADRIASLAGSTDVFVGVITRARRGGSRRDLVERAAVAWVDCDDGTSVAALARFRPLPSMVVASGSGPNQHAYWLLDEPAGIDEIERVNHRLALALGADLHCGDGARIMRPAGSTNRKQSPPTAVRLVACDEHARVALADLTARLAPDPEPTGHRAAAPSRALSSDPLLALAPRLYVERLLGQPVGRSGKVRCPFHPLSGRRAVGDGVSPAGSVADASVNDRGDGRVSVEGMDAQLPREAAEGASTSPAGLARSPRACSLAASSDPLRSVPPPVYFERLTGLRVGPSGKLRCLFHDDRSPSLHVYREPDRGWYCFGCGRGGSIYDLAALLSGRGTRGLDFAKLRRELWELMR